MQEKFVDIFTVREIMLINRRSKTLNYHVRYISLILRVLSALFYRTVH